MAVEALGRGLVVVGGDLERGVRAVGDRVARELDGLARGVAARAGDDLHAAGRVLDGLADHFLVLLVVEGGGFAGGADGADAGDAGGGLGLDERAERAVVDGAVLVERRDEGGVGALEHGVRPFAWERAASYHNARPPATRPSAA